MNLSIVAKVAFPLCSILISDTPVNNKEFFNSAGGRAEGILLTYIKVDQNHPASLEYQSRYGRAVNLFSANGYDAVMIADRALAACGYKPDSE